MTPEGRTGKTTKGAPPEASVTPDASSPRLDARWLAQLLLGAASSPTPPPSPATSWGTTTRNVTRPDLRSWPGLWRIRSDLEATPQYYPLRHTDFWLEHALSPGALGVKPDSAEAHNTLWSVLLPSGALSEAIAHYELSLKAAPRNVSTQSNLGRPLLMGGIPEARAHLETALRITPGYAPAGQKLAVIESLQGSRLP